MSKSPLPPPVGRGEERRGESSAIQRLPSECFSHTTMLFEVEVGPDGKPVRIVSKLGPRPVQGHVSGRDGVQYGVRSREFILSWYPNRVELQEFTDDEGLQGPKRTYRGGSRLRHFSPQKARESKLQGLQEAIPRAFSTWVKALEAAMEEVRT